MPSARDRERVEERPQLLGFAFAGVELEPQAFFRMMMRWFAFFLS